MSKLQAHEDYAEIIRAGRRYVRLTLSEALAETWSAHQVVKYIRDSFLGGLRAFLTAHGFNSAATIIR